VGLSGQLVAARRACRAVLLFVCILTPGVAGAQAAGDRAEFITSNLSLATLEREMTGYALGLAERNRLPVQRIRNDLGLAPRHLMYGIGQVRGSSARPAFPMALDQLTCGLNPKVCRIGSDGTPNWRNRATDELCVPALRWRDAFGLTRAKVPLDVPTLEARYGSCSALGGGDCVRLRESLRRAGEQKDAELSVPVLGQAALPPAPDASYDCASAPTRDASDALDAAGVRFLRAIGVAVPPSSDASHASPPNPSPPPPPPPPAPPPPPPSPDEEPIESGEVVAHDSASDAMDASADNVAVAASASDVATTDGPVELVVVDPIESATTPPPPPAPASPPAPPAPANGTLPGFDLSARNLAHLPPLPLAPPPNPVTVFVFDTEVNVAHPLLARDPNGRCGAPASLSFATTNPFPDRDHGTHVSALIGGCFGVGVNPYATLRATTLVTATGNRFFDQTMAETIALTLYDHRTSERVANFSYDLKQPSPDVRQALANTVARTPGVLFVAAAGNTPVSLDQGCETLPACLAIARPANLLVVGGVVRAPDAQLQLWSQSAHSAEFVDLLAPAEAVMSALKPHAPTVEVGRLSGTSQSAAIVSGIASLLFASSSAASPHSPAQVKHRLMATARTAAALAAHTRSGAVDAVRALAGAEQYLVVSDGNGGTNEYAGRYLGMVGFSDPASEHYLSFRVGGDQREISVCRLYRLSRIAPGRYFYVDEPVGPDQGARWENVAFTPDANLRLHTKTFEFHVTGEASPRSFAISDIVEFYDAFTRSRPCNPA